MAPLDLEEGTMVRTRSTAHSHRGTCISSQNIGPECDILKMKNWACKTCADIAEEQRGNAVLYSRP